MDDKDFDPETGRPRMYHGTAHEIVGGTVIPRSQLWHASNWDDFYAGGEEWRRDKVFASTKERAAWQWAQGPGRPRVHEVHVDDPRGGGYGEFHGNSAKVLSTHWTPPPPLYVPNAHVQGTLPPIDWGKGQNWKSYDGDEEELTKSEPAPPRNLNRQQFAGQGRLF